MESRRFGFSQMLLAATVIVAVILVGTMIFPRAGRQTAVKEFPTAATRMKKTSSKARAGATPLLTCLAPENLLAEHLGS